MKTETLGEIFFNGKRIGLENSSIQELENILKEVEEKENKIVDNLNFVLAEIQNNK